MPKPENGQKIEPEISKKAGRVATAPVLGCDGAPSLDPVPSAPPAPNVGIKTIYTQPGSTTLSAGKTKKLNVVFDFPDRKSRKKNWSMSNRLSKLTLQDSVYISDVQPTPFLCTNLENMDFQSHILGTVAIFTVESDTYSD